MAAGLGSFAVALLHAAVILIGPPAYRYFDAGDLAPLAERGSPVPALITAGLVVVFALWGLYAFSGAGLVRRLPLLRAALVLIAAVDTLRGPRRRAVMRVVSFITQPRVIHRILDHLARRPSRGRAPPATCTLPTSP